MSLSQHYFLSIDNAIGKLNSHGVLWFRGHTIDHTLLPVFYKVFKALENEGQLIEKYLQLNGEGGNNANNISTLVEMHHCYFPTRLLSWTTSIHVALFCALVRESPNACIFILDPVKLNNYSKLGGVVSISTGGDGRVKNFMQNESPIAISSDTPDSSGKTELFTIHGTNTHSLQEQFPNCISKVVLTNDDKNIAWDGIISGKWL